MKIISQLDPIHSMEYVCSGHHGKPQPMTLCFSRARVDELPNGVDALVATADLQGRTVPDGPLLGELVAEELETLVEIGGIPAPGAILLAGDFFDDLHCSKRGRSGEVGPVWQAFATRFSEVVGVHGNHDLLSEIPSGARVLDGHLEEISGMRIAGLGGIMGRATRQQRRAPESYLHLYDQLMDQEPEIMLCHCGPDEPSTGRIGEPLIREILERKGDALVIFGHCHWQDPLAEIGGNQLLSVDGRVVVLTR